MANTLEKTLAIDAIRSDFPALRRTVQENPLVYFDSGASAQKPYIVIDAIKNCYSNYYSNVHRGVHTLSQESTQAVEDARETIQKHISARHSHEIIFTPGTTASINLLAQAVANSSFIQENDEIILSEMEHHANIIPWQMIANKYNLQLKIIPITKKGELDLSQYEALLSNKTKFVSISHVSNVLGTINPVKNIIEKAHKYGALVHLDGAQAIAHLPVNVQDLNTDFYSFSGHKVFGPTGIGVLYGKEHLLKELNPPFGGGNMVDKVTFKKTTYNDLPHKFESGTPNIAGIIGLAKAIDYLNSIGFNFIEEHEKNLTGYFLSKLHSIKEIQLLGAAQNRVSVFSMIFDSLHPLDVGTLLNEFGIAVRTGHHCCQPLMNAFNTPSSLRASLAIYNTKKEIDIFFKKLHYIIDRIS